MNTRIWKFMILIVMFTALTGLLPMGLVLAEDPTPLEEALAGKYKGMTVIMGGRYDGSWASDYKKTFESFEEKTGITVLYSPISQDSPSFIALVEGGKGPDMVDFTYPSPIKRFAREGKVIDVTKFVEMETLRARYDQYWLDWATMDGPDGPIIAGVWSNFYVHSTVWYPKSAFDKAGYKVPTTWQELLALSDQIVKDGSTPWCIENGFSGGDSTGFPASWWIEDIVLRIASPTDYDKWIQGELKFSTWAALKQAVQLMSDIWFKPGYAYGGRQVLNTTYQWKVGRFLLSNPPKCWLMKEYNATLDFDGSSDFTAFSLKKYGQDYDFFLFPPIDKAYGTPVLVEGHITAMFHDRPEVRALMEYLTTGAEIEAWIKLGKHGGFSPHKDAKLDWYTIPRERALAEAIEVARKAGNLHFIAGDLMWPEVNRQYYASISAYVNGDIDLDTALKQIDAAWPVPER